MNLYLRIKLYLMRKLFGKGPVETVLGPMDRMLKDMGQVATDQVDQGIAYATYSTYAYQQGDKAKNIVENFKKLMS